MNASVFLLSLSTSRSSKETGSSVQQFFPRTCVIDHERTARSLDRSMSLSERDTLVLIIVGSIVGFFVFTLIICLSCCCWIRYWRRRSQRLNSQSEHDSPVLPSSRNHYQRSQKLPSTKLDSNYVKKTKRRRRRFNTNESAITLSFDPPHLINQNVKNLDRFFPTDPTMTTRSWHYEQTQPSSHTK